MNREDSIRYWERIRENREERMVTLRREADTLEREREHAHDTILRLLHNDETLSERGRREWEEAPCAHTFDDDEPGAAICRYCGVEAGR